MKMELMVSGTYITLATLGVILCQTSDPSVCEVLHTKMTCNNTLPSVVPAGVKEVYGYNLGNDKKKYHIESSYFKDKSWQNVTTLHMYISSTSFESLLFSLQHKCFKNLPSLLTLGIHTARGIAVDNSVFEGLDNLLTLDMSDCVRLKLQPIVTVINNNNTLPKLQEIIFSGINKIGDQNVVIDNDFVNMAKSKRINSVSFSRIRLSINVSNDVPYSLNLSYLDASDSSVTGASAFTVIDYNGVFQNLKVLNMSGTMPTVLPDVSFHDAVFSVCSSSYLLTKLNNLEILVANRLLKLFKGQVVGNNVTIDLSHCLFNIKSVHLQNNYLGHLNVTILFPFNATLLEMDLSNNNISYLSPNILRNAHNLSTLSLDNNNLVSMEYLPEFRYIFQNFPNLEHLTLGFNQLRTIPKTIFASNTRLKTLLLHNNNFKTISFQLDNLRQLELLDFSFNRIDVLYGESLVSLEKLYDNRNLDKDEIFHFNMTGNPVQCTCKDGDFIKFLNKVRRNSKSISGEAFTFQCNLEGDVVSINDHAVEAVYYLCHRTTYIVVGSVSGVLACILIIACVIYIKWRIQKQLQIQNTTTFLKRFLAGLIKENFLCLLTYANADAEVVMTCIYPKLNGVLRTCAGSERDVVCIDAKHYRVGQTILTEINRTTNESRVVVCIVSNVFCESDWCRIEIREACMQKKPIILLFVEDVNINLLSKDLAIQFQKYVRAKLVRNEDHECDVSPGGWQGIALEILHLASREVDDQEPTNATEETTTLL